MIRSMVAPHVFPHPSLDAYELLDSGHGEKLERVGPYRLRRPDPQAMWRPRLADEVWRDVHLAFVRESGRGGRWQPGPRATEPVPDSWPIDLGRAWILIRPTPFKHIGLFPEQSCNWACTPAQLRQASAASDTRAPRVLNLFAYTGAATVLATRAGAFVTHVDASRPAIRWAKENARLSGLPDDAIRWIHEDAVAFVRRERRRGNRYSGILLDPPPYGRGSSNEKWEFETQIVGLLDACRDLLSDGPAFLVLSCYAVGTSPLAFHNLLADLGEGVIEAGELAIPESGSERLLPAGLCGRWRRGT